SSPPATGAAAPSTGASPGNGGSTPANGGNTAAATAAAPGGKSFVPAVPLEETLPPWNPRTPSIGRNEYNGSLKVLIGVDGKVKMAIIVKPSHPTYDAMLLGV